MARAAADTGVRRLSTRSADSWLSEELTFSAGTIRKRSLALILLRLPAFIPLLLILRGWLSLNAKDVLTNTEADVLGTGGEICFFVAVSVTPLITLTGQHWLARGRKRTSPKSRYVKNL